MSWTEESILAAFPRANMTYYIQFVQEPKEVHKKGKYGPWIELMLSLQLFSTDEDGNFHYMGAVTAEVKPCVLESLSVFGPDIVTRLIEVKGFQHGKHVDLELIDSWDRISADTTGPPKPAAGNLSKHSAPGERTAVADSASSERGQAGAGGTCAACGERPYTQIPYCDECWKEQAEPPAAPCSHDATIYNAGTEHVPEGFYCKLCGERVG